MPMVFLLKKRDKTKLTHCIYKDILDSNKFDIVIRAIKEEKCKYNERYEKIKYIMKRLKKIDNIEKPLYVGISYFNNSFYPLIFVGSKSCLLEPNRHGLREVTYKYINALNPTKEYYFRKPIDYITVLEFQKNKLYLIEYDSNIITDNEFENIINKTIASNIKTLGLHKNY